MELLGYAEGRELEAEGDKVEASKAKGATLEDWESILEDELVEDEPLDNDV